MMEITSAPNKVSGIETGRKSEAKAAFDFETEDASDKSFEAEYGKNENPPAASPDAQATQQKLEESRADDPRDPQLPEGAPQQPVELFGTKEAKTGTSDISDSSRQSTMLARNASQAIAPDSKDQTATSDRPEAPGETGRNVKADEAVAENERTSVAPYALLNAQTVAAEKATSAAAETPVKPPMNSSERDVLKRMPKAEGFSSAPDRHLSKRAEKPVIPPDPSSTRSAETSKQIHSAKLLPNSDDQNTRGADEVPRTRPSGSSEPELMPSTEIRQQSKSTLPPVVAAVNHRTKANPALSTEKFEMGLSSVSEPDLFAPSETRTAGTGNTGTLQQLLAKPETPLLISRQMAEALQKLPDRPVEVSLNPSELGRVRMNIAASEVGITVSILTERPETLDLLRRNIDDLAKEFQNIGYETISFAFSEGSPDHASDGDRDSHTTASAIALDPDETTPPPPSAGTVSSGLDLRI